MAGKEFGAVWLLSLLNPKGYLILAAVLAGLFLAGYVTKKLVDGEAYKARAIAAEGAIATIENTGKAVRKEEERTEHLPIDKELCAKGWADGCPAGFMTMPAADPPKDTPKDATLWDTRVSASKVYRAPKKRRKPVKDWWCSSLNICLAGSLK